MLAKASEDKFYATMDEWSVPLEYAEPIFNYLVYGYSPGSFFTSVLANDFVGAMARSHPANTVPALKSLSGWIINNMPASAWRSYEAVDAWCKTAPETRRSVLEAHGLIYTLKEETWEALKGEEHA